MLYSAVGEWAQLDQDSTVLDVCCGTGTIGISLAKVTLVVSETETKLTCDYVLIITTDIQDLLLAYSDFLLF